jgi:siderophore synthetase component
MAAWTRALQESGENPQDWVPLPIHPYQAQQILPQKFEREIDARQLLIDHNLPQMRASPTMSFRTVACSANPLAPQMKLPAAIQMTSAQRTVSPRATVMGPRVSKLLREIIDRENGFEQTLAILPEDIGLHYIDPTGNADIEKHLSILYRQNPMTKATADQLPVPVAALFADSPLDGRPFAVELVTLAHGDHAAGAIAYFRDYAKTTLRATLSAYLVYGIAFEAHQQNTLVLLNKNGKAGQIIFRDFGDIRIDASVLHAQGMHIENYQSGHVLFDEATAVREKFLHTAMLCNLAELAQMLARSYQQNEDIYWQSLFHTTTTIFEELRIRCEPTRWEHERQAILYADWPVKALLRMRLENTVDDICHSMPNPLAAFSVRQP